MEEKLQKEIQNKIKSSLAPIFSKYDFDLGWLDSTMKWKPMVLVLGSYSSGKSTLINELLGYNVQRTGQAPTDDSFTVITNEGQDLPGEIPGSTLVNDPKYPFLELKAYGEGLISHFCLKNVPSTLLEDTAIIDTPGMIDSTAERHRGYRYLDVIGELAGMSDLIILMFDPHKAGTVKESFSAIRNVIPGRAGEDRVVFVLSRIDECENVSDLIRSYGTLCWNISQMTVRKDMPHIYLTYSPHESRLDHKNSEWPQEREALKQELNSAQAMRINHVLEQVDRRAGELEMVCEAMYFFSSQARRLLSNTLKWSVLTAVLLAGISYFVLREYSPVQTEHLFPDLSVGSLALVEVLIPGIVALLTIIAGWFSFAKIRFPKLLRRTLGHPDGLVDLASDYRQNLWAKLKNHVLELLRQRTLKQHLLQSRKHLEKVQHFMHKQIKEYYSRIGQRAQGGNSGQ
jgi:GTPase Era involved in 16S rRNA processing